MTILEAARALRRRQVSSLELTKAALRKAEQLNGRLRAFITVTADQALSAACAADAALAAGHDRGPLHGVPVAVKDLFLTRGIRTTGGSLLYENWIPEYSATVVERLESAGAVLLGKLNQHELAYGITSANPHFGAVANPWDLSRSPGGSSGGSGAAVAAGIVFAAMGSDTGGSIRIPASFCGVVGLKPTYGRVSRYGVLPLGYSLDHMGPLARCVRDAALMLNAIAGPDSRDESCSRLPTTDYVPEEGCSIRGLRIGLPSNFYFDRLNAEVETAVRGALARANALGAVVKPVTVPDIAAMNAVARVILLAEASAALEPFLSQRDRIGSDVLALLDQGRALPATDYIQAQRLRRKLRAEFAALWADVDCLLTPTTPNLPPRTGEQVVQLEKDEEDVRLATTRFVRSVNLLGLPALSMPCGLSSSGLPIGLQIIAPEFQEQRVFRVAAALEDSGIVIPPPPLGR
jgi:aspartyl-tRNA(Asn)/glutamyl-tRNA(Gln) amidotransferase subunit A